MSYRERLKGYLGRAHPPTASELKRFGRFTGRQLYRGAGRLSQRAVGLTPSEYAELRKLRQTKRLRELTGDEGYVVEMRRLKELEARYGSTVSRRKGQLRRAARLGKRAYLKAEPVALRRYREGLKRLRA